MNSGLNSSAWTVSIDTGSNFTDVCMLQEGSGLIFTGKVPSSPGDPSRAVEALAGLCQKAGVSPGSLSYIISGNTLALNIITANPGAKTALLVTRGFKDIIHINSLKPLVERRLVFEVKERVLPGGQVQLPLDENEIKYTIIPLLEKNQINSVAVCFLHSYDNPLHENRVKAIIKQMLPFVSVTVSSAITPLPVEHARALTAVANAAVSSLAGKYIKDAVKSLSRWTNSIPGHWFMQSDGSVTPPGQAADQSVRTILSSPAGGVKACAVLAKHTGRPNLITFEMGGTHSSFSILYKNSHAVKHGGSVGGYPLSISMYDINITATGGSSIARIDDRGALRVGPESAGSVPGPSCYGKGGKLPTCTDAYLILGRIGPDTLFPGGIHPDPDSARQAVNSIAGPLGISVESAARAIIKAANSSMIQSAREMAARNGYDPREFTLASFGGCGPLHAAEVALELGVPNVLVPVYPGFHAALGMLFADLQKDYHYSFSCPLTEVSPDVLHSLYLNLEEKARNDFGKQGISANLMFTRSADMRYIGQPYVINMQVPSGKLIPADLTLLKRAFDVTHLNENSHTPNHSEVEIVALKVMAMAGTNGHGAIFYSKKEERSRTAVPRRNREIVFGDGKINTPVYKRQDLAPNSVVRGPAVVEQEDATTLIWPRMTASVDLFGNIIINVGVN